MSGYALVTIFFHRDTPVETFVEGSDTTRAYAARLRLPGLGSIYFQDKATLQNLVEELSDLLSEMPDEPPAEKESPPSDPGVRACPHGNYEFHDEGRRVCLDCGHEWTIPALTDREME